MNEFEYSPALFAQWSDWRIRHASGGSARDTAYQVIRDKIIHLELKPGEALSDRLLADELGMSRTPVREALIILAAANMVVLKPQSGTFVAPIDTEWMAMEQFSRCAMEKEIVAMACSRVTKELTWQYGQNMRMYHHYANSAAPDRSIRLLELDNEFHKFAFTAAERENNFFYMLGSLQHIERMRFLSVMVTNQNVIYADHMKISRALIEGDRDEALRAMETHLARYLEDIKLIREKFPEYFRI